MPVREPHGLSNFFFYGVPLSRQHLKPSAPLSPRKTCHEHTLAPALIGAVVNTIVHTSMFLTTHNATYPLQGFPEQFREERATRPRVP